MKFIDLFSGIGGIRLGLEQAGHECIGYCEVDKHALNSYRALFDTEGSWFSNNICEVNSGDLPKADLWAFGFPCTDISVAGKTKGFLMKTEHKQEADCFSKLYDCLLEQKKKTSLDGFSLRMLKIYYLLMAESASKGLDSSDFSLNWSKSGTCVNGNYSIPKISECPNTENVSSLSDILEENVDQKYFLSKEQADRILMRCGK